MKESHLSYYPDELKQQAAEIARLREALEEYGQPCRRVNGWTPVAWTFIPRSPKPAGVEEVSPGQYRKFNP